MALFNGREDPCSTICKDSTGKCQTLAVALSRTRVMRRVQ